MNNFTFIKHLVLVWS